MAYSHKENARTGFFEVSVSLLTSVDQIVQKVADHNRRRNTDEAHARVEAKLSALPIRQRKASQKKFDAELAAIQKGSAVSNDYWSVSTTSGTARRALTFEEVLKQTNSGSASIIEISSEITGDYFNGAGRLSLYISGKNRLGRFGYEVYGPDELVSSISRELDDIIDGATIPYSSVFKSDDLIVLCSIAAYILVSFWGYKSIPWEAWLKEITVVLGFTALAFPAIIAIVIAISNFAEWLYPAAAYEIGDGKRRIDMHRGRRVNVFYGVVVATFIGIGLMVLGG